MPRRARETVPERDARRKAAYDRGWKDSLTALDAGSEQPWEDKYDYRTGWWACADARRLAENNCPTKGANQ